MPTRKQRKRALKERRHEYETVWVDEEGNELEEPPDDEPAPSREKRPSGKSTSQPKRPERPQRGRQPARTPLPPSWRRSIRRSLMLGGVIIVFFALIQGPAAALVFGVPYMLLFIPFTFYLDRFAYRRWEKGQAARKR